MDFLTYIDRNAKNEITSINYIDCIYCLILHDKKPVQHITIGSELFSPIFYKLHKKFTINWFNIYSYIDLFDLYICYELSIDYDYYRICIRKFFKDYFIQTLLFLNSKINYEQLVARLNSKHLLLTYNYKSNNYSIFRNIVWKKLVSIQENMDAYKLLFSLV